MKNKTLYNISVFCGLVPLTGGLFIFFTWWIARAFFAKDLDQFEGYGFLWLFLSFFIATTGLLLLIIFLFRNYPNFRRQTLLGLFLVLVNIPAVYWVLDKQENLNKRAYIRIYNNTNQNDVEITLEGSDFKKNFGTFDDGETLVNYYFPRYVDERRNDSYPIVDTVTVIVKGKFTTQYLTLPPIEKGQCAQLYIDKEFKLIEKMNEFNTE